MSLMKTFRQWQAIQDQDSSSDSIFKQFQLILDMPVCKKGKITKVYGTLISSPWSENI